LLHFELECRKGLNELKIEISKSRKETDPIYFFENKKVDKKIAKRAYDTLPRNKGKREETPFLELKFFKELTAHLKDLQERHQYPGLEDFETNKYYLNEKWHHRIFQDLENEPHRRMVIGKPSSGKSTLVKAVGFEWLRKEENRWVFYLNAERGKADNWQDDLIYLIKRGFTENTLLIIDDCHKNLEEVNFFADRLSQFTGKVLFATRPFQAEDEEHDIISTFPHEHELRANRSMTRGIIDNYIADKSMGEIGDLQIIYDNVGHDLHILRYYLEAWEEQKDTERKLSEIQQDEVLDRVYSKYLLVCPKWFPPAISPVKRRAILLSLSALSQYEILIHKDCIPSVYSDIRGVDRQEIADLLVQEGLVEKIEGGSSSGNSFYRVFHSTPAQYFLLSAFKAGELGSRAASVEKYTNLIIGKYLAMKPENVFQVFSRLHKKEHAQLKALYNQLDFAFLGQQANESSGTLVQKFIKIAVNAGITKSKWETFFQYLNIGKLGEAFVDTDKRRIKYNLLFLLEDFDSLPGLTPNMAGEFIQGLGRDNILNEVFEQGNISLDLLAAIDVFITEKCNSSKNIAYSCLPVEIKDIHYVKSISSYPLNEKSPKVLKTHGLNIVKDSPLLFKMIAGQTISLRAINMLLQNLYWLDKNFLKVEISPKLGSFSTKKWQAIWEGSDLQNISTFMKCFSSWNTKALFPFPSDVSLDFTRNQEWLSCFSLEEWSHLLFNFHYVNKSDEAILFAKFLQDNEVFLIDKMNASTLAEVDYICWSLLMAYPSNEQPPLFFNKNFQTVLHNKMSQGGDIKLSLGLIGVMAFSGIHLPENIVDAACSDNKKIKSAVNELKKNKSLGYRLMRVVKGISEKPKKVEMLPLKKVKRAIDDIVCYNPAPRLLDCLNNVKKLLDKK